ncbi:carbohydrate porin [Prochlorococcus marinus]|uniref:carbohydrate porin n=1 Tax=Prochlorococcus marinus TaxID=1219 RepID=UPI001ADC0A53|nr:carbohydrate porin [Prochlorococcus marinus]MBO8217499.1 carbohydrate porin [Prochlorococcus marinus XMU1405]MBW3040206.1 porin [Prochlorococcus marinus str. MU1405]MBW3047664.1 porin [Prochlorococcus marinus str. MU1406]
MKLFQKLIAAPAIISLASGLAVNAAEINSTDLSDYSNSNNLVSLGDFKSDTLFPGDWAYDSLKDLTNSPKFNGNSVTRLEAAAELSNLIAGGEGLMNGAAIGRLSDELGSELAIMKGRVDGLEARVNGLEAGSFSETTTMSGEVGFLLGGTDSATKANDVVQFEYALGIDLDTSFTGEDNLNIGIVTGNGLTNVGADKTGLDWGESESDALVVNDLNYTFPVGAWKVAVGDSMDASKTWPNACSMNNMVDNLGDCGAANSVDLSGNVSLSAATGFGDGWELGLGISGIAGKTDTTSTGLFTKEGTDLFGLALGYEADTFGFTVAYSDKDTANYYGLVAYYSPEELPTTFSGGVEVGNPDSGEDTTQWAFGISTDVGEGTLSANIGTNGPIKDNAEEIYAYDLSYEYPLNDSMSITPFVYISETTGTNVDTTGAGAFVSFSF